MPQHASALPSPPATSLRARPRRRRPLISLTPLIDVVFILLVFFMLASSFLDWRAIDLNAPERMGAGSSMEGALLVEVRPDGPRLSGRTVPLASLAARVQERLEALPGKRVLIKPAAGVALQDAVDVLDHLERAGVSPLSFIHEPAR